MVQKLYGVVHGAQINMGGMPMPANWGTLGNPVDMDPTYQAMLAKTKMGISTGVDEALQQALGGGQGTGTMRVAGDIGARGMTDFASTIMQLKQQSAEAAKARGLEMGKTELQTALDRAGLGMGYTSGYQTAQQLPYQEWQRQQYQNSPLFSALLNLSTNYPQNPQVPNLVQSDFSGILESLLKGGAQVGAAAAGRPGK